MEVLSWNWVELQKNLVSFLLEKTQILPDILCVLHDLIMWVGQNILFTEEIIVKANSVYVSCLLIASKTSIKQKLKMII